MKAEERQQRILDLLMDEPRISVSVISERLGVSQVTIRNDLKTLSEKGLVLRTHGSATPAFHPSILERQRQNTSSKEAIAKVAAEMVQDGDTVMIDAGTTTAMIVKNLLGKRDVRVVTSNLLALGYARSIPTLHLTMTGGEVRLATESMVGPMTIKFLEEYHVRLAFVGTDGFSVEKGTTTHLVEGAEVVRTMRQQSDTTILLADSSKYGKSGFAKILPLQEMDHIICDQALPVNAVKACKKQNIELTLVS